MQDSVAVQQNLILDGWDGICHQGAEIPVSLNCLGDNCFAGGWSQSPLDDCISLPQAQNLLDGHFGLKMFLARKYRTVYCNLVHPRGAKDLLCMHKTMVLVQIIPLIV